MAYTTAQLRSALLMVDGRATEGGIIELPRGARLLLDVLVEGSADGALLEDIGAALDAAAASATSAAASAEAASAISGAETADDLIVALDAYAGSAFRQQQDARLSATSAAGSAAHETATDFTNRSAGAWLNADTRHEVVLYPRTGTNRPAVTGGRLVFGPDSAAGTVTGYASQRLGGDVARIGARWTYDADSTTAFGTIALAATVGEIGASYEASAGVPEMPCHLTITPTRWTFDTFPGGGGAIVTVASAFFDTPLAADGTTEHVAEVVVDTVNGVATLFLPDGSIQVVEDPTIAVTGAQWAFVQGYRVDGTTDPRIRVRSFWADSARDGSGQVHGKAMARMRADLDSVTSGLADASYSYPTTDASFAPSASGTVVPGTNVDYTVPASGRVMCLASAFLDMTADGLAFFQIRNNAGATTLANVSAATATKNSGQITLPILLSGLTPGTLLDLDLYVMLATGAATVKLHNGGANAFAASLTVIPLD